MSPRNPLLIVKESNQIKSNQIKKCFILLIKERGLQRKVDDTELSRKTIRQSPGKNS